MTENLGIVAKYLFKTFNKNASSLQVPPSMQNVVREMIETLNSHSSVIQGLASATKDSVSSEGLPLNSAKGSSSFDEVDVVLHMEAFG